MWLIVSSLSLHSLHLLFCCAFIFIIIIIIIIIIEDYNEMNGAFEKKYLECKQHKSIQHICANGVQKVEMTI